MLAERCGWVSLVTGGAKASRSCARWSSVSGLTMKLWTPGGHRGCHGLPSGSTACAQGRELAAWAGMPAYRQHAEYSDQLPLGDEVWDNGHVDWAVGRFALGHDAQLSGPDGQRLRVVDRPPHRDQFLMVPLAPRTRASSRTTSPAIRQWGSKRLRRNRAPW